MGKMIGSDDMIYWPGYRKIVGRVSAIDISYSTSRFGDLPNIWLTLLEILSFKKTQAAPIQTNMGSKNCMIRPPELGSIYRSAGVARWERRFMVSTCVGTRLPQLNYW